MFRKRITFILLIMSVFILVACNTPINEESKNLKNDNINNENIIKEEIEEKIKPKKGGILKVATNEPKTLNPLINQDEEITQILNLVFEPLIDFNEKDEVTPNIATKWEFSNDGDTLILHLNENIYWHDGEKLTAEDVVYTIEEIKKLNESIYNICVKNISFAKVIDENTLKIQYVTPFSGALSSLFFPVIPKHYYGVEDVTSSNIDLAPIGCGPFIFEKHVPMEQLEFKSNNKYFKGEPFINKVIATITRNNESKVTSFQEGLIDVLYTKDMDWSRYSTAENVNLSEFVTPYYDFIGFNFDKSDILTKEVRQALYYGINRKAIISEKLLDHGVICDVPLNPNHWLYTIDENYLYDVDQAKSILEEQGWQDSNEDNILDRMINEQSEDFVLTLLVNKESYLRMEIAEKIKEDYSKLGVNIDIQSVESDIFIKRLNSGEFDLFLGGWKFSPILDYSFAFHTSSVDNGMNYIKYKNYDMDNLLYNAFYSFNDEDIRNSYKELMKFISEEVPYISLYFKTNALVTNSKKVMGEFTPNKINVYRNIEKWFIIQPE